MVAKYNASTNGNICLTPHVCRHTYCSDMARKGMNPKVLQYLMGHSSIGMTLDVYTHLGYGDAFAEVARVTGQKAS